MSKKYSAELLYALLTEPDEDGISWVEDLGWINERQFCVWVYYSGLNKFMKNLEKIFGCGIYDDGGFDANMQQGCVCIDLCEALGGYLDIGAVFPKDLYEH